MKFKFFKEEFTNAVCSKDETYYYAVKKDITIVYDHKRSFYNVELKDQLIADDVTLSVAKAFLKTRE